MGQEDLDDITAFFSGKKENHFPYKYEIIGKYGNGVKFCFFVHLCKDVLPDGSKVFVSWISLPEDSTLLGYTKRVAETITSLFHLSDVSNFFFSRMIENYDNIKRLMIDYPDDDYTTSVIPIDQALASEVVYLTKKLKKIKAIVSRD